MPLNPSVCKQLGITEEELIKQIHGDIKGIFSSMVGIEDLLHIPVQVDTQTHFSDCITAMIGFAGIYNGLLSVHVPQSLAKIFTSNMLGMEVTEVDDDVNDALGEIANMIGGCFKHHLSKDGHEVKLSTPSVVAGKEYVISSGSAEDTLSLMFDTNDEWFMVSVVVEME